MIISLDKTQRLGIKSHPMVTKSEISKVMATLGSRKTKAKADAARQNGRKGGRPRVKKQAAA